MIILVFNSFDLQNIKKIILLYYKLLNKNNTMKINLLSLLILFGFIFQTGNAQDYTLEDIFMSKKFSAKSFSGYVHLKDGERYAKIDKDLNIIAYSYKTGEKDYVLFAGSEFKKEFGDSSLYDNYLLCNDESKILFYMNTEAIYRTSSEYNCYVYDINSKQFSPVYDGKIQLAVFSPDAKKISFIRDNNLFIKYLGNNEIVQITSDGKINEVINGKADWVYEEEFGLRTGYDWSADSKNLAYIRFDESNVKEYYLQVWGELYPQLVKYKYPKAGEDNSVVTVHSYNLETGKTTNIEIGDEKDIYIPRIKWTKDGNLLSLIRLNRLQNKMDVLISDVTTGNSKVILTETNERYIDENYDLNFTKENNFLMLSDKSGFRHIYAYDINGNFLNQVTKGNYEVISINTYDGEKVYYAYNEPSPLRKAQYSINLDGTRKILLSPENGTSNASYSKGNKYFFMFYNNANSPNEISLNDNSGKLIRVIEENEKLKETMSENKFVKRTFFTFKTSDGTELNGHIMKPEIINENEKLPVIMYVYAGPGSQLVADAYSPMDYIWAQYLVKKGYIFAVVDGRGTGGRGQDFEKMNYMKLGQNETEDQIEAAKYLGSLPYVDKNRIGIFGWSYGGYMVSLCMTLGSDYFKTGVGVAPVTDWRYYDNIYTERYMRRPVDNPEGYKKGSPINYAEKLKGKLLLMHGTEDDNVHMQNTFDFITALTKAGKQIDLMIYPNKNHSIFGGNTRFMLFSKVTEYFFKNL